MPRLYGSHISLILSELEESVSLKADLIRQVLRQNPSSPQRFDQETAKVLFTVIVSAIVNALVANDRMASNTGAEALEYLSESHDLWPTSMRYYRELVLNGPPEELKPMDWRRIDRKMDPNPFF